MPEQTFLGRTSFSFTPRTMVLGKSGLMTQLTMTKGFLLPEELAVQDDYLQLLESPNTKMTIYS